MIGEPGRDGWGALEPLPRNMVGSEQTQAVVGPAEVVGGPDEPHPGGEGRLGARDGSSASGEGREVGAEGGIEPLDVGGVDNRPGGRRREDGLDASQGAAHDPAGDADEVPPGGVLDDLGELEPVRQDQPWTTAPSSADRLAEALQERGDVTGETVDADQDGRGRRTGPDPLDQRGDQG